MSVDCLKSVLSGLFSHSFPLTQLTAIFGFGRRPVAFTEKSFETSCQHCKKRKIQKASWLALGDGKHIAIGIERAVGSQSTRPDVEKRPLPQAKSKKRASSKILENFLVLLNFVLSV